MDLTFCKFNLAANAQRVNKLAKGISPEQARWKPDPDSWSILEVINHLLDEEIRDFRVRLEITLFTPIENWPTISPLRWVTERRYNDRDLEESVSGFLAAREDSLSWLSTLQSTDWEASYDAPWGKIRAGDLIASWVAHDMLHMRQIVELHWAYVTFRTGTFRTDYAGEW